MEIGDIFSFQLVIVISQFLSWRNCIGKCKFKCCLGLDLDRSAYGTFLNSHAKSIEFVWQALGGTTLSLTENGCEVIFDNNFCFFFYWKRSKYYRSNLHSLSHDQAKYLNFNFCSAFIFHQLFPSHDTLFSRNILIIHKSKCINRPR